MSTGCGNALESDEMAECLNTHQMWAVDTAANGSFAQPSRPALPAAPQYRQPLASVSGSANAAKRARHEPPATPFQCAERVERIELYLGGVFESSRDLIANFICDVARVDGVRFGGQVDVKLAGSGT